MKRNLLVGILLFVQMSAFSIAEAQSYNTQKVALANYLTRMYENQPFEGVRLVDDYNSHYLMSVLALDLAKYNGNKSTMDRVASVKAMSQASRFFNGSRISSDLVIRTSEDSNGNTSTEIIEQINENSVGYVKALELLTSFSTDDGKNVYIFISQVK